ncbi:aminoacyl-histidine dipeptidase [Pontibacter sp. MBLB2868]|uniref:aminoacyl-histidine dipeptidase n=1 Tax=Pontibacter sp. MBLB2868 TaxID=3451555 RepID=UPI003F7535CE
MNVKQEEVLKLEPQLLWRFFSAINAIPRASRCEERVAALIMAFGKQHGFNTTQDEKGNVLIRKPATAGMENRKTVLLQGHLDMVHQKNADTSFNFDTQGIEMYQDGDWVRANGTTLGADNGIGVAAMLAVLASEALPHPPLELLFTVDEEVGATGAMGLSPDLLQSDILLNLDSEDEQQLTTGCAGSLDVTVSGTYEQEYLPEGWQGYRLVVMGLTGGHSGVDIHTGRGNANKILIRLLTLVSEALEFRLCSLDGGSMRNAIPRSASAVLAVQQAGIPVLHERILAAAATIRGEFVNTDPKLEIRLEAVMPPVRAMPAGFQQRLLQAIGACPNGVYRMSPVMEHLVQTSNNLSRVLVEDGAFHALNLTRSFIEGEKDEVARLIAHAFAPAGAAVTCSGNVPGWNPATGSDIVRLVSDVYQKIFRVAPVLRAIHAGLECGIIGAKYPHLEMISFGPNIRDAHSPDERVQVSSVQKFWKLLLHVLQEIPENDTCTRKLKS